MIGPALDTSDVGHGGLPRLALESVVEACALPLEELSGSRILVTGATGFVGRWILSALLHARELSPRFDYSVVIHIRDAKSAAERLSPRTLESVDVVLGDATNSLLGIPGELSYVVSGATPASIRSGSMDRRQVLLTAIEGTQRLIELADDRGGFRLLNLSSGAVYGRQPPDMDRIPEDWMGVQEIWGETALYAEGKRASEALLADASRDGILDAVQARLFAFCGPGVPLNDHLAIGNFMADVMIRRSVVVHGDGTTIRSYLDARDMAVWLLTLLVKGSSAIPYNVGSPWGRPIRDWAAICAALGGVDLAVNGTGAGIRPRYVPDIANSVALGLPIPEQDPIPALTQWLEWLRK
jgi:dTDP-glucose 4,6-dehydratase